MYTRIKGLRIISLLMVVAIVLFQLGTNYGEQNNYSAAEDVAGILEGCYEGAVANYEATVEFLDENYIEKYPQLALVPLSSSEEEHEKFKEIAAEIVEAEPEISPIEAIYNWMNESVNDVEGSHYGVYYPLDVYHVRGADSDGQANLMCQLLRSAGVPAVVVEGYTGNTYTELSEEMMYEDSISGQHARRAWVLAYNEGCWQLLDTCNERWLCTKEEIATWYYTLIIDEGVVIQEDLNGYSVGSSRVAGLSKAWWDYEDGSVSRFKYIETEESVLMEFNKSGWVSNFDGRVLYFKDSMCNITNYAVRMEDTLYYFGANGEPFNVSQLDGKYKMKDGRMVVENGTSFEIAPFVDMQEYTIEWKTQNPDVITIDENGVLHAVGKGRADIECWITDVNKGYEIGYFIVLYVDDFVSELTIGDDIELEIGKTYTFDTVTDKTSSEFSNFFWESTDESVVTVDNRGKITALKEGTAIIIAEFADGSGLSDSCVITVVEALFEEVFSYQFVTVNGFTVEETKVEISLCNEIEDANKVLIEESLVGAGDFKLSYRGNSFVYEDKEYSMVEIYYRIPEGYILADSEGITENTVWYSVENLCDGSNEITWFLEEVVTEPEIPVEPEAPVIPEVDSDKLGEETKEQIEKEEDKHVEVVAPDSNKIDKDVFESMGKHDKDVTIGVKDKENGKIKYSWTFSNKELENRDMEIDLDIRIADDKKHHIKNHVGDEDMLCIEFAHHGELPGPATIRNYVGDTYKDGHKVWLYYYDEEKDKVFRIGGKPLEVKDGYIEYTITHCSTYFVMDNNLTNIEKDETSLADATVSVLDNDFARTLASNETDVVVPETADKSLIGVYITILFLGMTLLLTGKKYKKLS
ncbi:MAG: Ig-like domain-containing protein [Agathobacter sp.]|nr:Ig-like domain-containing protein [Agathobacter sp.]